MGIRIIYFTASPDGYVIPNNYLPRTVDAGVRNAHSVTDDEFCSPVNIDKCFCISADGIVLQGRGYHGPHGQSSNHLCCAEKFSTDSPAGIILNIVDFQHKGIIDKVKQLKQ